MMISFCQDQALPLPRKRLKLLLCAMNKLVRSFRVSKKEEPFSLEEAALLIWILHYRLDTYAKTLGRNHFMDQQKQNFLFSLCVEKETGAPKGATLH